MGGVYVDDYLIASLLFILLIAAVVFRIPIFGNLLMFCSYWNF